MKKRIRLLFLGSITASKVEPLKSDQSYDWTGANCEP